MASWVERSRGKRSRSSLGPLSVTLMLLAILWGTQEVVWPSQVPHGALRSNKRAQEDSCSTNWFCPYLKVLLLCSQYMLVLRISNVLRVDL